MPVIGFVLTSINAERKKNKGADNININSTPTIKNVEKRELNAPNVKEALAIEFDFETKYKPEIGSIKLSGEVLYKTEDVDKQLENWEKDNKLDQEIAEEILNVIFRRSLPESVFLAVHFGLPPSMKLPVVKSKEGQTKKSKEYIG